MGVILAYWDIRGLAQPMRLFMEYAGIPYEEKRYPCGPPPDFDKSAWFDVKFNLSLDFPNLPYLIDGELKMTQSNAIFAYLARKAQLQGKTETERVRADMAYGQACDVGGQFVSMCYNPNFKSLSKEFDKTLPDKLKAFEKFLGGNKWFAGANITYCDFVLFELFDKLQIYRQDVFKNSPNLKRFHQDFSELKPIKKYMQSEKYAYLKPRLNNRAASFGNGHEN